MKYIGIGSIICILILSFWQFIHLRLNKQLPIYRPGISFQLLLTLIVLYVIVIIGFGLIYFVLSFYDVVLVEVRVAQHDEVPEALLRSIYFSAVTMLTIGYGDIIPLGIGRFIVIVQALIGYLLPTSFVLKLVQLNVEAIRQRE